MLGSTARRPSQHILHGLWSLLEMLELNASPFVQAVDRLATLGQLIHDLNESRADRGENLKVATEEEFPHAVFLAECLRAMNLDAASKSADRLVAEMQKGEANAKDINSLIRHVHERMRDQLDSTAFIVLRLSQRDLYEQRDPLFGSEVAERFPPSAAFEIEEAGKCLALERSTAAVFHLMRAMEIGVRVLGEKLVATVLNKHGETLPWAIILSNMKPKIEAMPRGAQQDEWFKLHALLHSVNRAFRTKTAHPAQKYTQEEAENAFGATKAFMQEMASDLLS
jgi:hypothetical protein